MSTQSIIVYRNPLEQAMWEGLMNSNALFPIICGIVVFFAVFLLSHTFIIERYFGWRKRTVPTYVLLALSAMIGIYTARYML